MASYGQLGPFELRGELGRGAMARVWRAWDPKLQREVAIKEPLYDARYSDTVMSELGRRFVAEGRIAAGLSHPGIVTIYAADVYEGRPAIVMELIQGETLTQCLDRGPLGAHRALDILDQLLDAVGYAHQHGVVHRDIKPDNIFLTTEGRVKLTDFGIARVEDAMSTVGTVAGTVLGTPGYMSPEQAVGAPVDARSDLFSTGVVAYEMFAGHNPFYGVGDSVSTTTLLYRIVHEPVPELPDNVSQSLSIDVRPAIMAALEKDPANRPQSAEAFRAMLQGAALPQTAKRAFVAADSPAAFQEMSATSTPQQQPRRSAPSWLPYALVAGVATVGVAFLLSSALGSGGGGGGSSAGSAASEETASEEQASNDVLPLYYVGLQDGYVAIFSNSSTEPFEVSEVAIADLEPDSAAELGAQVPAASLDEANDLVAAYQEEAEAAQAKRAAEEAERAAEEAERAAEEAESTNSNTTEAEDTEYILPESNTRYYSREELEELSDWELWMARNEIYARNGRMFTNPEAKEYFASKSWYVPRYTPREFADGDLPRVYNDYERQNRDLIIQIEEERNSPYA